MCVCSHMCHIVWMKAKKQIIGCHVGPLDQTQVIRLDSKWLYLLGHLTDFAVLLLIGNIVLLLKFHVRGDVPPLFPNVPKLSKSRHKSAKVHYGNEFTELTEHRWRVTYRSVNVSPPINCIWKPLSSSNEVTYACYSWLSTWLISGIHYNPEMEVKPVIQVLR